MEKQCPICEDELFSSETISNSAGLNGNPIEHSSCCLECEGCGKQFDYEETEDGLELYEI